MERKKTSSSKRKPKKRKSRRCFCSDANSQQNFRQEYGAMHQGSNMAQPTVGSCLLPYKCHTIKKACVTFQMPFRLRLTLHTRDQADRPNHLLQRVCLRFLISQGPPLTGLFRVLFHVTSPATVPQPQPKRKNGVTRQNSAFCLLPPPRARTLPIANFRTCSY